MAANSYIRDKDDVQIRQDVQDAIYELESARMMFESCDEPELVDYAIYREKAALLRLSFLIKKAKNKKT